MIQRFVFYFSVSRCCGGDIIVAKVIETIDDIVLSEWDIETVDGNADGIRVESHEEIDARTETAPLTDTKKGLRPSHLRTFSSALFTSFRHLH